MSALLDATIDIAWNSPLAWLDAQRRSGGTCRAIAMRDTDRDRVSYIVARRDGRSRTLADLRGRTVAVGAKRFAAGDPHPAGAPAARGPGAAADLDGPALRRPRRQARRPHRWRARSVRACRAARRRLRDARSELGGWTADGTIDPNRFAILGDDGSLRPLRLHRPAGPRSRGGAAVARACSRCGTTTRSPGNDGSRGAEGVAAGPDRRASPR